jgi:hypothetical protein
MIKYKPCENSKFLSFTFYDKDEINKLFYDKLMVEAKNVFNLSLFCYNIFDLYKTDIYNEVLKIVESKKIISDYDDIIINKLIYYFDEYVNIKNQIKINNNYIYKFIINYINDNKISINKSNFNDIYNDIYSKLVDDDNLIVNINKNILFDNIIYKILYSIYNKNYTKTKQQLLDHKKINNIDNILIDEIKNNIYLEYNKSSNVKEKINNLLSTKLKADTTYISRFVYKKLGDKTKYL